MLSIRNLSKSFGQESGERIIALDNVSLEFPRGSFTTIIGGNGSGKSTLLNCIGGNESGDTGNIFLNGRRIDQLPDYHRASFMSRLFQNPSAGTAPDMSIAENFRIASLRRQTRGLRMGIDKAFRLKVSNHLEKLGLDLEKNLEQPVGQLSGGQRQALSLIMAIFDPPQILLLDEPTAALDPKSSNLVLQMANELIKEHELTCLFVTHNMQDALSYGDRLIQLHRGKIRRDLSLKEASVLSPLDLMTWFLEGK